MKEGTKNEGVKTFNSYIKKKIKQITDINNTRRH